MNEKQIDLDAMRALADAALNVTAILSDQQGMPADDPRWIAYDRAVDPATIIAYIDEIEQLRKERDALREVVIHARNLATRVVLSNEICRCAPNYQCMRCAGNRVIERLDAALAAQGDKP